jgi:hypothetical protein
MRILVFCVPELQCVRAHVEADTPNISIRASDMSDLLDAQEVFAMLLALDDWEFQTTPVCEAPLSP